MDIFSWLSKGTDFLYFLPSMILLIIVIAVCLGIYVIIFVKTQTLSTKIFKILLVPVVLLGFIIWAIPMKMGFYEFFKSML